MGKYPDQLKKMFGVESELEIKFSTPKKILCEVDKIEQIENVHSITILEAQNKASCEINYKNKDGNECSFATANKNFKQIIILD